MRNLVASAIVIGRLILGIVTLVPLLQPGPPAATRFAGVTVSATDTALAELPDGRHRLTVSVIVASDRAIGDCMAFALDNPFAGRLLNVEGVPDGCLRPSAGVAQVVLSSDRLTNDDVQLAAHALVWGGRGGRCGPILGGLFGLCAMDGVSSVPLELPVRNALPSFGPIGSLFPIFSFAP